VTPDGKHVYVANGFSANVSVIDTTTNTVVATVPVGNFPTGVASPRTGNTPMRESSLSRYRFGNRHSQQHGGGHDPGGGWRRGDRRRAGWQTRLCHGQRRRFSNRHGHQHGGSGHGRGGGIPLWRGHCAATVGVPVLAFNAKLEIDLDRNPKEDRFELESHFTLSSAAPAIHPHRDPVTLQIGSLSVTIPPGSFKKHEGENEGAVFSFHGVIDGVRLEALIKRTGTLRYAFEAEAKGANLAGTKNPVQVSLTIGGHSGTASVKADMDH
jgi:YVTN family beta-propeller protein